MAENQQTSTARNGDDYHSYQLKLQVGVKRSRQMSQILFIMDTTRVSTFATFFKIESRLTWHADRYPTQTTEQPGQQQQDGGQATHFFSEKHHLQSQFFSFFILVHFYRQKMYLFNYLCLLASCCVLFSMPPLFEIETKFYSKLWAALQEFATFYI